MSEGGGFKILLFGFFNELYLIFDGICDLQVEVRDVCKEVKSVGFDVIKLCEVEGWVYKVEKYGCDKMDDVEVIFDLYCSVVDVLIGKFEDMMSEECDKVLFKLFVFDDQVELKLSVVMCKMCGVLVFVKVEKVVWI